MINKFFEEVKQYENEEKKEVYKRFFKTQKGQYGYGDLFLGLTSVQNKGLAKKYYSVLSFEDIVTALQNPYHDIRACALMMLILKYQKESKNDISIKKQIFELYINNIIYINNWDLVDISAPHIVGDYLFNYEKEKAYEVLIELAEKDHLWSQRISVVSTLYFIKKNDYEIILKLSGYFLTHKHDLMHKAVGWMLRETWKKDLKTLLNFLDINAEYMPRTMLRYAIEKLDEQKRKSYLSVRYKKLS